MRTQIHQIEVPLEFVRGSEPSVERTMGPGGWASSQQEALFRFWEEAPSDPRQHLSIYCRLRGDVGPDLVLQTLESLVHEQPELRCLYRREGELVHRYNAEVRSYDLAVIDARSWTAEEVEVELARQKQEPFDLASGQIFRARMYSVGKRE